MKEIRFEDIERLGYQQLGVVQFDDRHDPRDPYVERMIEMHNPSGATAYWILYEINEKTDETYIGYVGEKSAL